MSKRKRYTIEIVLEWENDRPCAGSSLAGMLDRVIAAEIKSGTGRGEAYSDVAIREGGAHVVRINTQRPVVSWVWGEDEEE